MTANLPRLLGADLSETARFSPSALSVKLRMNQMDVANMDVPLEEIVIPAHSWVELSTPRGVAGTFRVQQVDSDYTSGMQHVSLQGGICCLMDTIYPTDGAQTKTCSAWLDDILDKQTARIGGVKPWVRAQTFDIDYRVTLTPNNTTLYDLLLQLIANDVAGNYLVFDQTEFPWKVAKGNASDIDTPTGIEGRLSRNVGAAHVSVDASNLCTRVISSKLTGGCKDSANTSVYGIIARRIKLDDDISTSEANSLASNFLSRYDTPTVSAEFDYFDLFPDTGEFVDGISIGKTFSLVVPKYNVAVSQLITGIEFTDVFGAPRRVVLTLGTQIPGVGDPIKNLY